MCKLLELCALMSHPKAFPHLTSSLGIADLCIGRLKAYTTLF